MAKNALPKIPFEKIADLTRVQRFAICIGTFVVLGGLFFYLFYMPRSTTLQDLKKNHEDLEMRLIKVKADAKDLEKYKKLYKEAQGRFKLVLRLLPDKKEIPNLLESISKSGRHSGLEFLLFKPVGEVKKGFYAEIPVQIQVKGGYHNLGMFFDKIAKLSRIVNVSNININTASKKGAQKILKASCVATTYRFVESAKKPGKGKKKKE